MQAIKNKIEKGLRLEFEELLTLYNDSPISELSLLADTLRRKLNKNIVLYNKNFHLEPSNICKHNCKFCSFRRDRINDKDAWDMTIPEVISYCQEKYQPGMTEVHIVGSSHPDKDLNYYCDIIKAVRETLPKEVAIKAYSAVEIVDMNAGGNLKDTLSRLKDAGLDAIPGGGAEILDDKIRQIICPDKATTEEWINVHRTAHKLGIASNATMLFGHIESREDRLNHILKLRDLQDETGGFNSFIPLKYLTSHNQLSEQFDIEPVSTLEVLRTFAIARLALDNIQHIKAYWPMLGIDNTQLALLYGADDIDGTVNDSTKIYSLAGASEQKPQLSVEALKKLALSAGYKAVERNSFGQIL